MSSRRRKKPKKTRDPNECSIVQVAAAIGKSYQHTRNMMLQGKFGRPKYDIKSQRLTVRQSAVDRYLSVIATHDPANLPFAPEKRAHS